MGDSNRNQIYNDWSRLIELKTSEPVFEGDYSIETGSANLTPKIYIWDNALPSTNLKNVVILSNFGLSVQNVTPNFPYTGTWYDLMDETGNTSINVTNVVTPINIPAGGFKIYGNQNITLSADDFKTSLDLVVYPNPVSTTFQINKPVDTVSVYDILGKLIIQFKGDFQSGYEFDVSKITQGLYIVKFDYLTNTVSKRLIIN